MDPLAEINTRQTPQSEQARSDQVANSAGGYSFAVDDRTRAMRFLILGTEGGTYYISQRDLTKENAAAILRLADTDGEWLVATLLDVSLQGRAPKQNPTLFALAACTASNDLATRRAAMAAISKVCRTGTMLFIFARYVEQFRGWGRALRSAIADWYTAKPVDRVAFQAVKYRQREGWSHRDLLRLSHPKTDEPERRALFDWITHGMASPLDLEIATARSDLPVIVEAHIRAVGTQSPKQWAQLVSDHNLPWEALPDAALNQAEVWEAMVPHLGITALMRNLNRLTNLGLIAPMGGLTGSIVEKLTDSGSLKEGRVHPLNVLVTQSIYGSGHGLRGGLSWEPNNRIIEALNDAFYLAFDAVEPANKRTLLALDVSGSMTSGQVAGAPLTPIEAEAALAMVTVRTEPEVYPMAFSGDFVPLPLTASQRVDDVVRSMWQMPFDRTDCAVPMQWASRNKVPVDTFAIYTDNETWAGSIHPFQALRRYRDIMGIPARLIVVGMTSNGFSIADPSDAGMLDVVGFDTAVPNLMTAFSRGDV